MIMIGRVIYSIFCVCTAMIGHTIHGSVFWSIVDFFFTFFAWAKWLICHEVTLEIIKKTFAFFIG